MLLLPKKKVTPFPKKKLVTSEKVTTSEEVDKGTKNRMIRKRKWS